jgi:hypothetical protein
MFHSASDIERLRRMREVLRFGRFEIRPTERLSPWAHAHSTC